MSESYTLFGMAASLYTARVRSYMRCNAVPFKEVKAGSAEYLGEIVPQIGRWIIPVIKTPTGEIIQDGADIIDHLDKEGFSKKQIYPDHPALIAIAHVLELYGAHGLLRPAMHYRWNFDDENLAFIRDTFRDVIPAHLPAEAQEPAFLDASGRMRKAAVAIGVTQEAIPAIEESYGRFLQLMNTHLDDHPFMLGGHPTIADYGLIGAMYAHLGRDPAPLHLMQKTAPRVFRWVERMNMAETFEDEAQHKSEGQLVDGDHLPQSLLDILRFIAEDYLPEITAHVQFANTWLDENPEPNAPDGDHSKAMQGPLGMAPFEWRGAPIASVVLPYRFFLLHRLQDAVERQENGAQTGIHSLFASVGLETILTMRTNRRLNRSDNREVWGELMPAE